MKTRRILSALLTVAVLLSTFVFAVPVAAEGATVLYVNADATDAGDGSQAKPYKDITNALTQLASTGGTIKIVGTYVAGAALWPSNSKRIIIEGANGTSSTITTVQSAGPRLGGEIEFRNITLATGSGGHWNTNGAKLTLGEGMNTGALIHVGREGHHGEPATASEHIVIDGGAKYTSTSMTIGGAYIVDSTRGIAGNAYIDVLDGELNTLRLGQDGYSGRQGTVTIGGDVKVKVGSSGKIVQMNNQTSNYARVKGYFHVIVEDGGTMCGYDLTNFDHKETEVYRVNVKNPTGGTVNNTDKTGEFEIEAKNGYVAKITKPNGTKIYLGNSGKFDTQFGETTVEFIAGALGNKSVEFTIQAPTPGESDFPISIVGASAGDYDAEVFEHKPNDATVQYSTEYTYTIKLTPKSGKYIPADIAVGKINDSEDFRISAWNLGDNSLTFKYVVAKTGDDNSRYLVTYNGGYGTVCANNCSETTYAGTVGAEAIYDVQNPGYTKAGYDFMGFSIDGKDTWEDGMTLYHTDSSKGLTTYTFNSTEFVHLTFTAVWKQQAKYNATFVSGTSIASNIPFTLSAYQGQSITLPENPFTNIGYLFTGWNDGTDDYAPGALYALNNETVTFTAKWAQDSTAGSIVYVDTVNGSSDGNGTLAEPYNSLATAVAAKSGSITAVIIGTMTVPTVMPELADAADQITIVGYDSNSTLLLGGTTTLSSATVIKDIKINAKSGSAFVTNGNKSVFGPNLANVGDAKFDIYDGGNGTVEKLDTTIEANVTVGTYYFGGKDGGTVSGNADVTVNGGTIDELSLAPQNGKVSFPALKAYVFVNIAGGDVKKISMRVPFDKKVKNFVLAFSNGMIPDDVVTPSSAMKTVLNNIFLSSGNYRRIIDSGVGGQITEVNTNNGRIKAQADSGDVYLYNAGSGSYQRKTGWIDAPQFAQNSFTIAKLRYGAALSDAVAIAVDNPVGGAETFSIQPSVTNGNTNVTVALEGWSPALAKNGDREFFKYETLYTVTVRISPVDGKFFNDSSLPAVTINSVAATPTLNKDGTLSVQYNGFEETSVAPVLSIAYSGDGATGVPTTPNTCEHMGTMTLPNGMGMEKLGYYFLGWRSDDPNDGALYGAGDTYTYTSTASTVTFTAQWGVRGSWELPQVVLLYDLTAYASDTGRNPKFEKSDSPVLMDNAFDGLEKPIGGTQQVGKGEIDHVKGWKLESDGSSETMMFNSYRLDAQKVKVEDYKYVTIVYYYDSKSGTAIGQKGEMTFGNVVLTNGETSNWFGKPVVSGDTVVANKWSTMTFDLTEAIEAANVPEGSIYRQCHIWPIGKKTCKDMKGDALYLKAMYLSKKPTVR